MGWIAAFPLQSKQVHNLRNPRVPFLHMEESLILVSLEQLVSLSSWYSDAEIERGGVFVFCGTRTLMIDDG